MKILKRQSEGNKTTRKTIWQLSERYLTLASDSASN